MDVFFFVETHPTNRSLSLSLDVEVVKDIVTFNEREDEDILVEEGPQIERGTVFHRDACHREIYQRNFRDKRLLREACCDGGDVTVKKNIVTLNEERGGRWEDRKFNAAWCFSGAHATGRFTKETFVTSSCRLKRVFGVGV